jgi:FkbM family methyltransferase
MIAVQIGSNKGYDDFTDLLVGKNVEKLIMVEPFFEHNVSLAECYEHITNKVIENIIITDDSSKDTERMYFHPQDSNHSNKFELASLNRQHSLKIRNHYSDNEIVYRELPSTTINNLFDKHNITIIDLLFIDTEGYDDKIIYNIDFSRFTIKELYYENLHIDSEKLESYLINNGYSVTKKIGHGGWTDYAKLNK